MDKHGGSYSKRYHNSVLLLFQAAWQLRDNLRDSNVQQFKATWKKLCSKTYQQKKTTYLQPTSSRICTSIHVAPSPHFSSILPPVGCCLTGREVERRNKKIEHPGKYPIDWKVSSSMWRDVMLRMAQKTNHNCRPGTYSLYRLTDEGGSRSHANTKPYPESRNQNYLKEGHTTGCDWKGCECSRLIPNPSKWKQILTAAYWSSGRMSGGNPRRRNELNTDSSNAVKFPARLSRMSVEKALAVLKIRQTQKRTK